MVLRRTFVMERKGDNKSMAEELLPILVQELEKAKANKDHKVAAKLRKQIWVATDFSHGVQPDMPDSELREILVDMPLTMPGEERVLNSHGHIPSSNSSLNRLKNLQKRLDQIAQLKEKKARGEKLEKNQVDKLATEENVKAQFDELEQLIAAATS